MVTYIDFEVTFDSVTHKFLDEAFDKAGASQKSRALFRSIYAASQGSVRIKGVDVTPTLSSQFNVARGVIQGDIISPIFFILTLDQLTQTYDTSGQGIDIVNMKELN